MNFLLQGPNADIFSTNINYNAKIKSKNTTSEIS